MITLERDTLVFQFNEVHAKAQTRIHFQRTLRIPDDTTEYPLPPGLGRLPVRHTEDYTSRLDRKTIDRGGVMMPLYRTEAMWIAFEHERESYPCAIKIATGKINALSGKPWTPELDGSDNDYVVVPGQPWLDGYCVGKGQVRQFVAMPMGEGYSVEEQITAKAEWGGLQIIVYPMKRARFAAIEAQRAAERRESERREAEARRTLERLRREREREEEAKGVPGSATRSQPSLRRPSPEASIRQNFGHGRSRAVVVEASRRVMRSAAAPAIAEAECARRAAPAECAPPRSMGLAAGGRMRQQIIADPYGIDAWDQTVSSRCFISIVEADGWAGLTGYETMRKPLSAQDYAKAGLPWFDYTANAEAIAGAPALAMVKSVAEMAEAKGLDPLADNESVEAGPIVQIGPQQGA